MTPMAYTGPCGVSEPRGFGPGPALKITCGSRTLIE